VATVLCSRPISWRLPGNKNAMLNFALLLTYNKRTTCFPGRSNIIMISVILPVYNEAAHIATVLDCLAASQVPNLEVIVVDDASTDDTAQICSRYSVTLLRRPENGGPARCRNAGAAASHGELLLFLDADIQFDPELLPRIMTHLDAHPHLAGALTLTAPEPLNPSFAGRFVALQDYLRYTHICAQGHRSWSYITTRFGLLKREVFEEVGGFNESLRAAAYEDLEFCARMSERHQLALDPDWLVRHHFPDTLWKMLRRLHVNARGVMSFPRAMRRKVSAPFTRDRNARILLALSWLLGACGFFAPPLWIGAALCQLGALRQVWWLPRGFYRHEGLLFAVKGWLVYNATLVPFATGVARGVADTVRRRVI